MSIHLFAGTSKENERLVCYLLCGGNHNYLLGFPSLPCLSHIVSSNLHFCLCYLLFATDPTFIRSTFIPDEEKLYFFFTEVGREYDFIDKFIVSRVSQICVVSGNDGARLRTVQTICKDSAELWYLEFSLRNKQTSDQTRHTNTNSPHSDTGNRQLVTCVSKATDAVTA